jgi:hypothetical protein
MGLNNEKMLRGMCSVEGYYLEPFLMKNLVNYYIISNPFGLDKEYVIHLTADCIITCKDADAEIWLNKKLQDYIHNTYEFGIP